MGAKGKGRKPAGATVMAVVSILTLLLCSYVGPRAVRSLQGVGDSHVTLSDSSPSAIQKTAAQEVTVDAKRRSIAEIFQSTKTDKYSRHHYYRYYDGWLAPFRSKQDLMMAEIGADQGKSLLAWAEYFDHPKQIVGVAYGPSAKGVERVEGQGNLSILRGDQSKKKTMDTLCAMGPFDIITDDGSHVPKHMIFSFFSLFKNCLNPGGLYIIEDIETNYWKEGRALYGHKMEGTGFGTSPADNAVEKMKQFIDILTRYQLSSPDLSIMDGDEAICSIEFGMNILVVKKCAEEAMRVRPLPLREGKFVDVETREKFVAEAKRTNPSIA